MTVKGYASQEKFGPNEFATVSPVREEQNGLDVIAHSFYQEIGSDTAETGSTQTVIKATGHAAIKGDVISWTSGALATREYRVLSVDTNEITVVETMASAPANGNAFDILRAKTPVVDGQGQLSVGVSLSAEKDAGPTTADTLRVVIANDQATDTLATEATLAEVLLNVETLAAEDFATSAKQDAQTTILTSIESNTSGAASELSAINSKTPGQGQALMAASTPVAIASDQSSIPVSQDGPWIVDVGSMGDITGTVSLPTGASTAANQTTANSSLSSIDTKLTVSNIAYQAKGKISGTSLTGTYATLLNPTSDIRILLFFNSCDATILVSLDGGTTDTLELEAGESCTIDLATNGLKFDNAVNISAKHGGAAPTSGTIRATGIG